MQQKLSVVIITYNEERNIKHCLESIQNITDDIVIVDSFSTDNTPSICQQFKNVNFVQNKWDGYTNQKNFANNLTKYNWVLSLDADERLSDELKRNITKLNFQDHAIYSMSLLNKYCGKYIYYAGWYIKKKYRLFNKNYTLWQGQIHEKLYSTVKLKQIHIKGDILHLAFNTPAEHIKKEEIYAKISGKNKAQECNNYSWLRPYLSSAFKFITAYIFHLGFLHGKIGYILCKNMARGVFLKYQYAIQFRKEFLHNLHK